MKRCKKCKREKTEAEFSKARSRPDQLQPWCRGCRAKYNAHYFASPRGKAAHKRYDASPKGKMAQKRRNAMPEHKAAQKRSNASHPDRQKARGTVAYAVQSGRIPPAKDLLCLGYDHDPPVQAESYHHESYEEAHRLDVIPVCNWCHGHLTARERQVA